MLRQRVITGLMLASGFLSAIFFLSSTTLAVVFGVIIALGSWEWSRLAGWDTTALRVAYVVVTVSIMAALYWYCNLADSPGPEQVQPVFGLACLWWSIALLWLKGFPASAAMWGNLVMRSLMGLLILVPAWISAVFLLSLPKGSALMVAMIVVVVTADIGAYFSGKRFGKHKLAPAVSPGKTWEGFWGGMLSCSVLAVLVWYLLPTSFDHVGLASVVTVFLTTALVSVVGDLVVSMIKRDSGVKDSGSLLPGHGGLMDRLDSICGAAPVFALGLLLAGW